MPDIDLLQPVVLRGVVQQFNPQTQHVLLNRIPKTPWTLPTAVTWDVTHSGNNIARPNTPDSEAHIVPRHGVSQMSAHPVELREKKIFTPTTLRFLREPGTLNRTNAEARVRRELRDLNDRFDNFAEYSIWQMLTGTLTYAYSDVVTTVDYGIPASHKPSVGTSWETATPQQIVADVIAWKRKIKLNSGVEATEAFTTDSVVDTIISAWTSNGDVAGNLLSDRMKDTFFATGTIPNFLGMNWAVQSAHFDPTGSSYTANPVAPESEMRFIKDNAVILANLTANNPWELLNCPPSDLDAPVGFTGKFAKSWVEPDPSGRQYLLDWRLMPILTRPSQVVYVDDVTA